MTWFQRLLGRIESTIGGLDIALLIGLLATVVMIWGFIGIAELVEGGRYQALDEQIVRVMRDDANPADPVGPPWLEEIGRDLTALGGVAVIAMTVIAVGRGLVNPSEYFMLMANVTSKAAAKAR